METPRSPTANALQQVSSSPSLDPDIYRYFPSDGHVPSSYCDYCTTLTVEKLLGPATPDAQAQGKYHNARCYFEKPFKAVEADARTCRLCHSLSRAIRMTPGLEPPRDGWLYVQPVVSATSSPREEWKLNEMPLGGFKILQSRPAERVADHDLLGFLRCTHQAKGLYRYGRQAALPFPRQLHHPPWPLKRVLSLVKLLALTAGARNDSADMHGTASMSSSQGLQHIARWIHDCAEKHPGCDDSPKDNVSPKPPARFPRRLLYLYPEDSKTMLRLLQSPSPIPPYVALSYCWGKIPSLKATSATLSRLEEGIPMSSLPETYRHTITIMWGLGLRWLWIDALCIIQDSVVDWQTEAPNMKHIYSRAYLTVVAAVSDSVFGGCFPLRPSEFDCAEIAIEGGFGAERLLSQKSVRVAPYPRAFCKYRLSHEAVQQRAWTLQESLLSRCILYCSKFEYIWLCRGMQVSELNSDLSRYATQDMYVQDMLVAREYPSWMQACWVWEARLANYSRRAMTVPTDKLVAIQGLIGDLAPHMPGRCNYGLWEDILPIGLLWKYQPAFEVDYENGQYRQRMYFLADDISKQRYVSSRAPSWSWASVDGEIKSHISFAGTWSGDKNQPLNNDEAAEFLMKTKEHYLVDAAFIEDPLDEHGKRDSSRDGRCLQLKGALFPVTLLNDSHLDLSKDDPAYKEPMWNYTDDWQPKLLTNIPGWFWQTSSGLQIAGKVGRRDRVTMDDPLYPQSESSKMARHYMMPIQEDEWMILGAVEGGYFRRLGIVTPPSGDRPEWKMQVEDTLNQAVERTIIIC